MSQYPHPIEDLDTPAILVDSDILEQNISRMQHLVDQTGIKLRPHVKTHKSVALARRQLYAGASGIAVAKLGEAEVMAAGGITNIQIANQVVGRTKVERLAALAAQITVSCAVDSLDNVREINDIFGVHGLTAEVLIEIDTGLHRSGLNEWGKIFELAQAIETLPHVRLEGIMTHAGHAYGAPDQNTLAEIGRAEATSMVELATQLETRGIPVHKISAGSTPTAQHVVTIPGITELRVGNYIFNDAIQVSLGVARWEQCALSVLTTVISVHPDRIVIDAGSKVFSSDAGAHGSQRLSGYGKVVGLPLSVTRLSEEHGVVQSANPTHMNVGDRLRIIPNHACPVMNLAESAWLIRSGSVLEEIPVDARAKTR